MTYKKKEKEPHKTVDDHCCACEYDIAVFEDTLRHQRHSLIEEIIENLPKVKDWDYLIEVGEYRKETIKRLRMYKNL